MGAAEVAAQFSKSGGTLVADVVGVFGAKSQGLASSTKALFNSIMGFAKQEGLTEVRVQAVAVVNKDLEQRLIKQGWEKTTVIVDGEKVSAYKDVPSALTSGIVNGEPVPLGKSLCLHILWMNYHDRFKYYSNTPMQVK